MVLALRLAVKVNERSSEAARAPTHLLAMEEPCVPEWP